MRSLTTRFLLTCAAIGVAGGLLLIPVNHYAATFAKGVPLLYAPVVGFWLLPCIVALALLRRPGASILVSLFAGLINVPTTPYGPSAVVTTLMVGVLLEVFFAATLYRVWSAWLLHGATLVISVLYGFVSWNSLNVASMAPWVQVSFIALLVLSGQLAVLVGRVVAARIERTGVTRGLSRPAGAAREPGPQTTSAK